MCVAVGDARARPVGAAPVRDGVADGRARDVSTRAYGRLLRLFMLHQARFAIANKSPKAVLDHFFRLDRVRERALQTGQRPPGALFFGDAQRSTKVTTTHQPRSPVRKHLGAHPQLVFYGGRDPCCVGTRSPIILRNGTSLCMARRPPQYPRKL